ncbi:acetyl-CoA hydrolase [Pigmentiphaga sp. NML030171]|nr:acetyl-CoA hydrolase [Pigmentiphaga sp. NML030171]
MEPAVFDLAPHIRPGDTVLWGQAQAQPLTLIRALVEQRRRVGRVRVFLGIGHGLEPVLAPELADDMDFVGYCGAGSNRTLLRSGVMDILPAHYSEMDRMIRAGRLKVDVLFLQLSKPDEAGRYSLGMARDYLVSALDAARTVIAEVDEDVPWTFGGPYLREGDVDLLVPASCGPAVPGAPAEPDATAQRIGRHVAGLVPDGATIQTGIGTIPDAVLAALGDHRDLGVHSGSLSERMVWLTEAGVITNRRKPIDTGVTVGGLLFGGERVRRFVHKNPAVRLRETGYTHAGPVLDRLGRFVAINSAVEVDLTGQVNSEVAGGRYVGAVGGIADFMRAAGRSRDGVPVIALPATAGGASRIVASLSGPVTLPRSDAGIVVTEHGAADLRGLTLRQRAQRMLAIAAPEHREALARAAGI